MVGVMDFLPTPALHLFKSGSGVVVPALVVPVNPTGMVGRPCELADVIGKFAETRLTFAQRLLSAGEHCLRALAVSYFF